MNTSRPNANPTGPQNPSSLYTRLQTYKELVALVEMRKNAVGGTTDAVLRHYYKGQVLAYNSIIELLESLIEVLEV